MRHKAVNTEGPVVPKMQRQQGLTLFELVVFILVVAIIFAYAMNHFREYPGAAERANFLAVTAQLKAGVNLRMMQGIARGTWHELAALEGSNPMDLMLENPPNYVGEFSLLDESTMPRRTWYFDTGAGELVYLASDATHLYEVHDDSLVPTDHIRLRIRMVYNNEQYLESDAYQRDDIDGLFAENEPFEILGGEGAETVVERGEWVGLVLEPVTPYEWEFVELVRPR